MELQTHTELNWVTFLICPLSYFPDMPTRLKIYDYVTGGD